MTNAREPKARYRSVKRQRSVPVRRVNARLDEGTAQKLAQVMRAKKLTVTQALKEAVDILHRAVAEQRRPSSYEVALKVGIIGCDDSGPEDLSTNYKHYLYEGLSQKHGISRPRDKNSAK